MVAIILNPSDFSQKVLQAKNPVFVDFFAPWCGPCRLASPVIDELAQEYQGKIEIFKVNIDEAEELVDKYQVMSVPTVIIFKEGKEAERITGFVGKEAYEKIIEAYL